jgi:hypothetical protein
MTLLTSLDLSCHDIRDLRRDVGGIKPHNPSPTYLIHDSRQTHTMSAANAVFAASNLFALSGFKAVVTGGGTGIGLMVHFNFVV